MESLVVPINKVTVEADCHRFAIETLFPQPFWMGMHHPVSRGKELQRSSRFLREGGHQALPASPLSPVLIQTPSPTRIRQLAKVQICMGAIEGYHACRGHFSFIGPFQGMLRRPQLRLAERAPHGWPRPFGLRREMDPHTKGDDPAAI